MGQVTKVTDTYFELNKVLTRVTYIGKNVGDRFEDNEKLIIILPGNPGANQFYEEFMLILHETLKCTVWCVGHGGHNKVKTLPKFNENKELYGLEGQVQNKLDFFDKYVPKNAKVHIIGHSVGAYMALELLDRSTVTNSIEKAYLLFPAIENLAKTPYGKLVSIFVRRTIFLSLLIIKIFSLIPEKGQNVLIHIMMYLGNIPSANLDNIREMLTTSIFKRMLHFSIEELDYLLQRNDRSIKNNIKKIKFFYSEKDGWAPMSFYQKLKTDHPNIDAEITHIKHVFVFHENAEVANKVSNWILNK